MKELNFKPLTAEQIEVRPTDTKVQGKCSLLLYIDSRCAAKILNDTVGVMNWQISYKDVAGTIYGRLEIWDDERNCWIYKEDTGSEANIEAEKSKSSDILKRCLARWGCDYLYYTPKIKIDCPQSYYFNNKMCMTFQVNEIEFVGKECVKLVISDRFGNIVFNWAAGQTAQPQQNVYIQLEQPQPQQNSGFQLQKRENPTEANGRLSKPLYVDIVKSDTVERLQTIYQLYPELHQNQFFTGTLTKRKNELQAVS